MIHAVGPDFNMEGAHIGLVHDAYTAALREAKACGATVLYFALLSAGLYRGSQSLDEVIGAGIAAITSQLQDECTAS